MLLPLPQKIPHSVFDKNNLYISFWPCLFLYHSSILLNCGEFSNTSQCFMLPCFVQVFVWFLFVVFFVCLFLCLAGISCTIDPFGEILSVPQDLTQIWAPFWSLSWHLFRNNHSVLDNPYTYLCSSVCFSYLSVNPLRLGTVLFCVWFVFIFPTTEQHRHFTHVC